MRCRNIGPEENETMMWGTPWGGEHHEREDRKRIVAGKKKNKRWMRDYYELEDADCTCYTPPNARLCCYSTAIMYYRFLPPMTRHPPIESIPYQFAESALRYSVVPWRHCWYRGYGSRRGPLVVAGGVCFLRTLRRSGRFFCHRPRSARMKTANGPTGGSAWNEIFLMNENEVIPATGARARRGGSIRIFFSGGMYHVRTCQ